MGGEKLRRPERMEQALQWIGAVMVWKSDEVDGEGEEMRAGDCIKKWGPTFASILGKRPWGEAERDNAHAQLQP